MRSNNYTSFIIISSIIILIVFSFVITYNLLPKNVESNAYYSKTKNDMTAKIQKITIDNNKLTILTSGDAISYCLKTTRSTPTLNSLCWKEIKENFASTNIISGKKYYIWIKDSDNNISDIIIVNNK